jgi:hypothetical protein
MINTTEKIFEAFNENIEPTEIENVYEPKKRQ